MNLCKTPREASMGLSADFLVSDFYNFSLAPHGVGVCAGLGWGGAHGWYGSGGTVRFPCMG